MLAMAFAGACGVIATGCTVGPDFRAPSPPTDGSYLPAASNARAAGAAPALVQRASIEHDWYTIYANRALDDLVERALAANPTRAAAEQRVAAAREAVNVVYGGRYPNLEAGAGLSRSRASGLSFGATDPLFVNTFNLYQAQLTAAYNLDIFGELTRRIENAQALAALAYDRQLAAEATLVTNVVATAFAEAGARTTRTALQAIAARQRSSVALIQDQERLGSALKNDVLRAQARLAATEALIPDYDQQIAVARHRLAILTGVTPAQYAGPRFTLDDFTLPATLPLTLPSALVVQRPDIRAARDLLHAASAQVGVATAEMLPKLQLTAGYSRSALKPNAFGGPLAEMFSVGAGLTAPLFEGGKLRAQKRQAQAEYKAATQDYRATVLNAFDEVANALRALDNDAARLAARQRGRAAAEASARLIDLQFRAGSADLLSSYLAQIELTQAEIGYASARLTQLADSALLMRALGGGRHPAAGTPPPSEIPTPAQRP